MMDKKEIKEEKKSEEQKGEEKKKKGRGCSTQVPGKEVMREH